MSLAVALTAFVLVFPVELPDKTFVATLVLATKYRPLWVWVGVSLAFLVQTVVAVTAGGLIGLLPHEVVAGVAAALFLVGAVVLWRGAARAAEREAADEERYAARTYREVSGWRASATSFTVLFVAEWGDLSQLLTAGLAARYRDPGSVFVGSFTALVLVAGLAALLGRALLQRVQLSTVRRVGATICLLLAAVATYDLLFA